MLSTKELMPLNSGAREDSWKSLGQQGDPTQSVLEEINPECLLGGLMLKLKLQYFGHLIRRTNSLEETLMLGKIDGRRRRGDRRQDWWHRLDGIINSMDVGLSKLRGIVKDREPGMLQSMGLQRFGHYWVTEQQQKSLISFLPSPEYVS